MHEAKVRLRTVDHFLKVVDRVRCNKGLSYHELYCLASLMKVDLFEKLEASFVDKVDIVVHLYVVGKLAVNHLGIVNYASVLELLCVDRGVRQVTIQVVKLVQVERVALV